MWYIQKMTNKLPIPDRCIKKMIEALLDRVEAQPNDTFLDDYIDDLVSIVQEHLTLFDRTKSADCIHYCPEWDYMLINAACPEFDACLCNIPGKCDLEDFIAEREALESGFVE